MSNNRKKIKLREIANITMGQSPSSKFYNNFGYGLPFLQGNRTFGDKYPTFDTWTNSPTKIAEKNDVIMSVRAPVGDLNITPVQMCLGRGVCSIRSLSGNNEFIYYSLKNAMKVISANGSKGTVFDSINRNDLENIEIFLPTNMEEQIDISTILSNIDSLIENNKKFSTTLEEAAKSLYDYWFTQFDFPDENGKPYRTSGGKMVWNEELKKEIPIDWNAKALGTYFDFVKGCIPDELTDSKPDNFNYLPYLTIEAVNNGKCQYCLSHKKPIANGNVLMVMDGAASSETYVGHYGVLGSTFAMLDIKNKNISDGLLYYITKSNEHIFKRVNTGSTVPHANKNYISSYKLAFPSDKDLAVLSNTFKEIVDLKKQIFEENIKLSSLREYLLPLLMNGQVTIAD